LTIIDVAQKQLDAYNSQALDLYCSFFTEDVVVADVGGATTSEGIAAYRARYAKAFADFPHNKADPLARVVVNDKVIDHERVRRGPQGPVFEVAAVYTFRGDKISRVDFVK
jgi:hypothetical protein